MKALTLWPEWIPAILHLGKHVENRTWRPNIPTPFELALHAGAQVGGGGSKIYREEAANRVVDLAEDAGWIVDDDVLVFGSARLDTDRIYHPVLSAIVAIVTVSGVDQDARTPWDMASQYHWRLSNIRILTEPVPCRGAQGIWTVPGDVEAAVLAAIGGVP